MTPAELNKIRNMGVRELAEYIAIRTPALPQPENDPTKLPNEETEIAWHILKLLDSSPSHGADTAAHFESYFEETILTPPAGSGSISKFKLNYFNSTLAYIFVDT